MKKACCEQSKGGGGSTIWLVTGLVAGLGAAALLVGRKVMQNAKPSAEQIVLKAESLVSRLEHSLPEKGVA